MELSDSSNDSNYMQEWTQARTVLANFDDRLDNLRKYGFSFLTALLTADSILLPASIPALANQVLPDEVKLAVLAVNLVLIVALQFMDRNYSVFLQAAESRALVLESILNLELTHIISQRYSAHHVRRYVAGLYVLFVIGVLIVGYAVFYVDKANARIFNIFYLLLIASFIFIAYQLTFRVDFPYGPIDWIVYPQQCQIGDKVTIVASNLDLHRDARFHQKAVMWKIKNENGRNTGLEKAKMKDQTLNRDLTILHRDSYAWQWDTSGVLEGTYRVHRPVVKQANLKRVFGGPVQGCFYWYRNKRFHEKWPIIEILKTDVELERLPRKIVVVKPGKKR